MRKLLSCLSLALLGMFSAASSFAAPDPQYPVIQLQAGIHLIRAEVASTPAQREQGLMSRTKMGQNEGMLFVFGAPATSCMWMKNTYIPLSVAFIDQAGIIVNIEDMQPLTEQSHCSNGLVHYALEMNQGWFKQRHVKPGSRISGLP